MNKVIVNGRLTSNNEIKKVGANNDISMLRFTLAVPRTFKNINGEYETDFINFVAYRQVADKINEWVNKGDLIGIEGRIQTGKYQDKDGNIKYTSDIIADRVEFLSSTKKKETNIETNDKVEKDPYESMGDEIALSDDDLPFN